MALRFVPQIDGLEDCYIDVAEAWTRAEVRELAAATDEATMLKYIRAKVTDCRLARPGAEPFVGDGEALSVEDGAILDTLDLRLIDFVGSVLIQAASALRSLGNLSGRLQSSGIDNKPK